MSVTWRSAEEPVHTPLGLAGRARAASRGLVLVTVVFVGVLCTLFVRFFEASLHPRRRPWTGWITVSVCRISLRILGLRIEMQGRPMEEHGILVANHSSWLDIFVLNAAAPLYFVSKAEVAEWPGIGWLARLTGTVFIRREAREAGRQKELLEERISAGHRLLFFPEGTSTDGLRVLPFKPTLFAALFSDALRRDTFVQPVTVAYQAPDGMDQRFYGWWGDMEFGSHLVQMLAASRRGKVTVTWHEPLPVVEFADRKSLAKAAEVAVRGAHPKGDVSAD